MQPYRTRTAKKRARMCPVTIAEFVNYYEEGLPPETPSQDGTLPATTGDAFIAQTSDPSNPVLWVVLMVVALVGVGVAFWLKKRGRNRK